MCDLLGLVDRELNMQQQRLKATNHLVGCSSKSVGSRLRKIVTPFWHLWEYVCSSACSVGVQIQERHWTGASPVQATKLLRGLEIMAHGERLRCELLQSWGGGQRWNLRAVFSYLMGGMEGTEPETSCGYVVIGQEAIDLSCNTGKKQLDIKRYLLVWDFFLLLPGDWSKHWNNGPEKLCSLHSWKF